MIFVHVQRVPAVVLKKLSDLFELLRLSKKFYEDLAKSSSDRMLQRSLRAISQEYCQFANEIGSQLLSMGNNPETLLELEVCTASDNIEAPNMVVRPGGELITLCTSKEKETIAAYRNVLNEFEVHADLRNMLRYQLNGVLCSFLQLKLLNA